MWWNVRIQLAKYGIIEFWCGVCKALSSPTTVANFGDVVIPRFLSDAKLLIITQLEIICYAYKNNVYFFVFFFSAGWGGGCSIKSDIFCLKQVIQQHDFFLDKCLRECLLLLPELLKVSFCLLFVII